ncbi:MAG: C39 family peptidase [Bacilli bacterium]|nr:C39 family peptidase [Bacilli bacterium]
MILSLSCDAPEFLNTIVIIKKVLVIAQIMAPIVLIILSSIDIAKAVMAGNEDDIMRHVRKFPKRLLSLSVIYFVPIIINFTVSLAQDISEYSECYANATEENVLIAYQNKAEDLVATAEKQKTRKSLSSARGYLSRLSDEELINAFNERLNTVEAAIKAKEDEEKKSRIEKWKEQLATLVKSNAYFQNSYGAIENPVGLPYYNQGDSRYKSHTINGTFFNIQNNGCGYVSFAMIAAGLKDNPNIIPQTVLDKWFHGYNGYLGTAPFVNGTFANKFNLKYTSVFDSSGGPTESQKQTVLNELKKGHPCVALVPHHYITLAGMKDNYIYILDPGDYSKNGKYTYEQFRNKYGSFGMAVCYYK